MLMYALISAKSILLNLHAKMAREGYTEIHVHQEHDVNTPKLSLFT